MRPLGCGDPNSGLCHRLLPANRTMSSRPASPEIPKAPLPLEQRVSSSSLGQSPLGTKGLRLCQRRPRPPPPRAGLDPVPPHLSSESTRYSSAPSGWLPGNTAVRRDAAPEAFHPARPAATNGPRPHAECPRRAAAGLAVHTDRCLCERAARPDGRTARPALPWEGSGRQGRSGLNESISPAFS